MATTLFFCYSTVPPTDGSCDTGQVWVPAAELSKDAYVAFRLHPLNCADSGTGDIFFSIPSQAPANACIATSDEAGWGGAYSEVMPSSVSFGSSQSGAGSTAGTGSIFDGFTVEAAAAVAGAIIMLWAFAFCLRLVRKQIEGA